MRNIHIWKATDDDGRKREFRAERFGGRWRFQSKTKGEDIWAYYDEPPLEELVALRDVVWRKYQRKRLPWDDVATLDQMIKDRGGAPVVEEE